MTRSQTMKRALALLLILALAAAAALPAFGAEPGFVNFNERVNEYVEGMFPDVPEDWYTPYVAAVYTMGLMQGDADGCFRPDGSVTLAETAALAARIHKTYQGGGSAFTQGEPWYQVYVDYCRSEGILNVDYADYNAAAKRSEFAVILSRSLPESALPEINAIADGEIPDVAADDAGAKEIYLLYRAGVLTGNDPYGSFAPDSGIRRCEVAAVVSRMAYRSLRREVTLLPKPLYPDLPEGERRDDDFFADAAMLGNSLVDGMMICSGLKVDYYGQQSANVLNYKVSRALQKQYGKIYIQLGINDYGLSIDSFIDGYRKILNQIREAMPEADIYIMAVTPITKAKNGGQFSMTHIREMNQALYDLAAEQQCWYLDCCEPLCTDEGFLLDKYAGWDGSPHLDASGYVAWAEEIRTHYAPEG